MPRGIDFEKENGFSVECNDVGGDEVNRRSPGLEVSAYCGSTSYLDVGGGEAWSHTPSVMVVSAGE